MQTFELGADSKRLLMEIRDRLPAAAPPADPAEHWSRMVSHWEITEPKTGASLTAWLTPDNQVAWIKSSEKPTLAGCRMLYVGKGES